MRVWHSEDHAASAGFSSGIAQPAPFPAELRDRDNAGRAPSAWLAQLTLRPATLHSPHFMLVLASDAGADFTSAKVLFYAFDLEVKLLCG
jgi:hypothetical protein